MIRSNLEVLLECETQLFNQLPPPTAPHWLIWPRSIRACGKSEGSSSITPGYVYGLVFPEEMRAGLSESGIANRELMRYSAKVGLRRRWRRWSA